MFKNENMTGYIFPQSGAESKNGPWVTIGSKAWVWMIDQYQEFSPQNTKVLSTFPYFQNLPLPNIISNTNNIVFKYKEKNIQYYVPESKLGNVNKTNKILPIYK